VAAERRKAQVLEEASRIEFEKEEAMLEREGLRAVMAQEMEEEERISEEERMIEEMMK